MISKYHLFGIFGTVLLIVALFAPMVQLSGGKTIGMVGIAWLILVATIIWSGKVILSNRLNRLLWPALLGTAGAVLAGYQIYKAQLMLEMLKRAEGGNRIDPMLGQFQWGWLPLVLGIFCLFLAAISAIREYR